jgi:hypothetical protein
LGDFLKAHAIFRMVSAMKTPKGNSWLAEKGKIMQTPCSFQNNFHENCDFPHLSANNNKQKLFKANGYRFRKIRFFKVDE